MLILLITALWLAPIMPQAAQEVAAAVPDPASNFAMRARPNLLFGQGVQSRHDFYDVVITQRPVEGVLIKLPYTRKGGKLTFDLHHRIAMSDDFGLPAEVMTVVELVTGGTNRLGSYTLLDMINEGDKFEEGIERTSDADIDRFVMPMARKSITLKTQPGPQSISVIGREMVITRGASAMRVDTPGTRIAMVSNIRFEAVNETNPLKKSGPGPGN